MLAPKFVGERIGARRWAGLLLGLAREPLQASALGPVLLSIGALIGITAAMLYEKQLSTAQDPLTSNLLQYSVGLFCAPMALFFEHTEIQWTPTFIATLAYLVIGNSLIAITLLLAMTRAGKVSQVASLFFFVPPAAAVMSYSFSAKSCRWPRGGRWASPCWASPSPHGRRASSAQCECLGISAPRQADEKVEIAAFIGLQHVFEV